MSGVRAQSGVFDSPVSDGVNVNSARLIIPVPAFANALTGYVFNGSTRALLVVRWGGWDGSQEYTAGGTFNGQIFSVAPMPLPPGVAQMYITPNAVLPAGEFGRYFITWRALV